LKARRILLGNYEIDVPQQDGSTVRIPYDVKKSLGDIILAPQLKLNGTALLRNFRVASRIIDCLEESILLETQDYGLLLEAVDKLDLFGKNDVELVRRIIEAEEVTVTEKGR
jgi:hypothetical protein